MGANATQVQAVIDLGAASVDGVDAAEAATFYGDYVEVYQNAANDPHEVAAAAKKVLEPVSIATVGLAPDISTDGGTSDCSAAVTQWDGNISVDVTYHLVIISGAVGATIDSVGLVTASGETGGDGIVSVHAVSNVDSSLATVELITITNQAT